jgi:hypothetical protein
MTTGEDQERPTRQPRVEDLWTRFVAREVLSAEERIELAGALERDEVLRRRLIQDLQLEGVLRAAGEIDRGQEHVVAQVKALVTAHGRTEEVVAAVRRQLEAKVADRRWAVEAAAAPSRRTRVVRWLTASALVASGAAAVLLLRPQGDSTPTEAPQAASPGSRSRGRLVPPASRGDFYRAPVTVPGTTDQRPRPIVARLEAIEGPAYRHGPDGIRRAAPSLDIAEGDWISTSGGGARARLEGPGGSRLDISGDASLGITAEPTSGGPRQVAGQTAPSRPAAPGGRVDVRVFLAHGRASAVLPPARGGPALVLTSPHAIVSGEGTVRLDVASATTRVEVREGRARVLALGVQRGTDVSAGQLAMVSAEDLQPPRAQNVQREALLLLGPDDTKEAPAPLGTLRGSEELLKARLERLGFQVHVADAGAMTPDRARSAQLIVFSSSVNSKQLRPWFAELPVGMLVLESTGFERLGLTGTVWRRDLGPAPPMAEITIQNPGAGDRAVGGQRHHGRRRRPRRAHRTNGRRDAALQRRGHRLDPQAGAAAQGPHLQRGRLRVPRLRRVDPTPGRAGRRRVGRGTGEG